MKTTRGHSTGRVNRRFRANFAQRFSLSACRFSRTSHEHNLVRPRQMWDGSIATPGENRIGASLELPAVIQSHFSKVTDRAVRRDFHFTFFVL